MTPIESSRTFEPTIIDPKEMLEEELEELELAVPEKLLKRMHRFVKNHTGADFAGVRPPVEKIVYKHPGTPIKRRGGSPPKDFEYVENFIDLGIALDEGDFETAIPLFYKLNRLVK
jgi:hypothetical protein